jgi:NADPH-dependent glutamate synthase beta subunit-like oxidoreductase
MCLRKGGAVCNAIIGDNRYHSIFGSAALGSYPCTSACPAGTAIPAYLEKVKNDDFDGAACILVDFNPLTAVTGRVCPAFCEHECNRAEYDDPVAIRCVERTLGDYMLLHADRIYGPPKQESGKKVAIVGSGPAGLAAAYYLRKAGHSVTVYERFARAGGMLLYSIPGFRLPKDIVKKQVKALEGMGITFVCSTEVGNGITTEDLQSRFDAVLVATGAWKEKTGTIRASGQTLSGIEFLKRVNEGDLSIPGKKVAIVGGGNVALDVARTLVRLGGKPVVIYRRTAKEMPVFADEAEKAREEGVAFRYLTLPVKAAKAGGKISLTCVRMKLGPLDESGRRRPMPKEGSEFTVPFDAVIRAIGEGPDTRLLPAGIGKSASKGAFSHLLKGNLYAAGDFKDGSSTVVEAVASGRQAALLIDSHIGGIPAAQEPASATQHALLHAAFDSSPRLRTIDIPAAERVKRIDCEDQPGIMAEKAEKEAGRCFSCGCAAVSPSDVGTTLVALGGEIVTTKRRIDAAEFFAPDATRPTILEPDEMITEIRVPKASVGAEQQYLKFTLRKPIDFAIVSVASLIATRDGKCTDARIALGAVAPAPIRAYGAEARLKGREITEQVALDVAEAAVEGVEPLSKNAYKIQITKALVKRAILGERA